MNLLYHYNKTKALLQKKKTPEINDIMSTSGSQALHEPTNQTIKDDASVSGATQDDYDY